MRGWSTLRWIGWAALVGITVGCDGADPAVYRTQPGDSDRFCILGDTRRPHPLNLWSRSNADERRRLIRAVAKQRPAFVLMSGDFVYSGGSARQWAWFDRTLAPLRLARIAILPALGNHELYGGTQRALAHYFKRFPGVKGKRWYRRDHRGLVLLQLDSNKKRMSAAQWRAQASWYGAQLRAADADPRVRGVLVTVHHAPVTNSSRHRDNRAVNQTLVPPFVQAKKTRAMVAGHVHTYERFVRKGKTFLNSGGGGASRRSLLQGSKRRHLDDQYGGGAVRAFHYVSGRITKAGISATTHGLRRGAKRLHVMERFTWPWVQRTRK